MKKLLAVIAFVGFLTSCNNEKKEAEKTDETTTTTVETTTEPTSEPTSTAVDGVPTFSDPEVQKFANDYAAFMAEYKAGMKDPAKLAELSKGMQDWSSRAQSIGMKLASKPEEAKAWAEWVMQLSKSMMPAQ